MSHAAGLSYLRPLTNQSSSLSKETLIQVELTNKCSLGRALLRAKLTTLYIMETDGRNTTTQTLR